MTLDVPSEYEAVIQQAVASGAFANPEAALRHALDLLAVEQSVSEAIVEKRRQKLSDKFREWVDSHPPVNHFVDDSRESIY